MAVLVNGKGVLKSTSTWSSYIKIMEDTESWILKRGLVEYLQMICVRGTCGNNLSNTMMEDCSVVLLITVFFYHYPAIILTYNMFLLETIK